MSIVIDPHHHFWRLSEQEQSWRTGAYEAIAADFGPADLESELGRSDRARPGGGQRSGGGR